MHDCNNTTSVLSFLAAMFIALLLSPAVYAGETRIIKDKGIEIEAFLFGKGSQTLIIAAGNATPKSEWTGAGTAPMLVLTCLQDIVAVPENGLNIAKQRPNTWLIGIPSCGHNMVFEQPDALRQLIIEYIQSVITRHGQGHHANIYRGKGFFQRYKPQTQ